MNICERTVHVHLGYNYLWDKDEEIFNYEYLDESNKHEYNIFQRISHTLKNKNFTPQMHIQTDDIADYTRLLNTHGIFKDDYHIMHNARPSAKYDYKLFIGENKIFDEKYNVSNMKQLQIILNQPYINLETNDVFRLYQNFNLDKSNKTNLIFDILENDIPLSVFYENTRDINNDNENDENNNKLSNKYFKDYYKQDANNVIAITASIKKLSLKQVENLLNIFDTLNKKQTIEYYKNTRNKFKSKYS